FEIFRAHHGADAAAAGVAAFVADCGEADSVLAGFADGGDARARTGELGANQGFALEGAFAAQLLGAPELHFSVVNEQVRPGGGPPADDERVDAEALQLEGEIAGRKRVGDKAGERRLGDDGKLGGGGEAGADQRRAGENQRVVGSKRIRPGGRVVVEKARAESHAAEKFAQARFLEITPVTPPGAQIDVEQATVKTVHRL